MRRAKAMAAITLQAKPSARVDDEKAVCFLGKSFSKSPVKILGLLDFYPKHLDAKRMCGRLERVISLSVIVEDREPREGRDHLLQNLDLLGIDIGLLQSQPCDVAGRPGQTSDKFIRIVDRRHDNRYCRSRLLGSPGCCPSLGDEHMHLLSNEFLCERAQFRVVLSRACLYPYRAAFNIPKPAKSGAKRLEQRINARGG